jgi:hypothetical protein
MKEEEGNRKPRGESGRLKLTNLKLKTPPKRPESGTERSEIDWSAATAA